MSDRTVHDKTDYYHRAMNLVYESKLYLPEAYHLYDKGNYRKPLSLRYGASDERLKKANEIFRKTWSERYKTGDKK